MSSSAHFIKKIVQKDNHTFTIEWSDGKIADYRLNQLQQICPCAKCKEFSLKDLQENVRCKNIQSVGRYALRIEFTSGCSSGIYDFDFLRNFAGL